MNSAEENSSCLTKEHICSFSMSLQLKPLQTHSLKAAAVKVDKTLHNFWWKATCDVLPFFWIATVTVKYKDTERHLLLDGSQNIEVQTHKKGTFSDCWPLLTRRWCYRFDITAQLILHQPREPGGIEHSKLAFQEQGMIRGIQRLFPHQLHQTFLLTSKPVE